MMVLINVMMKLMKIELRFPSFLVSQHRHNNAKVFCIYLYLFLRWHFLLQVLVACIRHHNVGRSVTHSAYWQFPGGIIIQALTQQTATYSTVYCIQNMHGDSIKNASNWL